MEGKTNLECTIYYWERKLEYDRFIMNSTAISFIERTIKYLKELPPEEEQK